MANIFLDTKHGATGVSGRSLHRDVWVVERIRTLEDDRDLRCPAILGCLGFIKYPILDRPARNAREPGAESGAMIDNEPLGGNYTATTGEAEGQ